MTRSRLSARLLYAALLLTILIAQLARLDSLYHRWFCVDEFEHLHAAWCMTPAGGSQVPYRDFFEHHTPMLYVVLAPILAALHPERSYDNALNAIFLSRWLMYALCCLILFLTYKLGKQLHSKAAGLMAIVFTLSTMMFIDRTTEIRPDLLSTPCMLATLLLTLRAVHSSHWSFDLRIFTAGLLSALAILATPKSLFYLDGYGLALLYMLYKKKTFKPLIPYFAGLAVPLLLAVAAFSLFNGAAHFIVNNFLLNAHWQFRLDPWQTVHDLAYENPLLVALGMAGLCAATINVVARGKSPLVPATTLALIAGIFIIPVPYTEYFVPLIPLLAIEQAGFLLALSSRSKRASRLFDLPLRYAAPLVIFILILLFILIRLRPPFTESPLETLAWILSLPLTLYLHRKNFRHLGLLLLLVMMSLFPARRFLFLLPRNESHPTRVSPNNTEQRESLRYIHTHTAPTAAVFDGWQHITAPFRPHAFHYFFLHREIRPMLPDATWEKLQQDLEAKTISPAIVIMDEDNLALPKPIVAYFQQHYRPTEIPCIWTRIDEP